MPKYSFGNIFINIEPVNSNKKIHKDIIARYFNFSVLKNPVINDMSAVIVNKTTIIVTTMCILS